MPKQSENRDRIWLLNRERNTETETERCTTDFCCDCTAMYPGLRLANQAIAQATSSLDKTSNRLA